MTKANKNTQLSRVPLILLLKRTLPKVWETSLMRRCKRMKCHRASFPGRCARIHCCRTMFLTIVLLYSSKVPILPRTSIGKMPFDILRWIGSVHATQTPKIKGHAFSSEARQTKVLPRKLSGVLASSCCVSCRDKQADSLSKKHSC